MFINCPRCKHSEAKVNRTYATEQGSSKEAICKACGHRFTLVTTILRVASAYRAKQHLENGQVETRLLPGAGALPR